MKSDNLVAHRFSRAADSYDQHARIHRSVAEYLVNRYGLWPSSEEVLDLGCGTGIVIKELLKRYTPEQIIGIDISYDMLKKCEMYGIRVIQADFAKLPSTQSFSTLYSSMSLQWCTSEEEVRSCINQLLLPGGRFAVSIVLGGTFSKLSTLRKEILSKRVPAITPHSPSDELPQFNILKEYFSKEPFKLYGSEKHTFKDYFSSTEQLFESIKGLGISGLSSTPLLRHEFIELKENLESYFTENKITPNLNYEVGFFWGEKK